MAISTITRVSTDASGAQGNCESYSPSISADGRYVTFQSYASDLVPGDTNGIDDIFVKDLQTGAATRVSTDTSTYQGTNSNDSQKAAPTDREMMSRQWQ